MASADLYIAKMKGGARNTKTKIYAGGTKATLCSRTQCGGITPKEYFVQI